jgi:hypothetical protein
LVPASWCAAQGGQTVTNCASCTSPVGFTNNTINVGGLGWQANTTLVDSNNNLLTNNGFNKSTSCNFYSNSCCLEFSYCDLYIENNTWKSKKLNVTHGIRTPGGYPPISCSSFDFKPCAEWREKYKKIAKCCAAEKGLGCSMPSDLCFDVDISNYVNQLTEEDLFNYLRRFYCVVETYNEANSNLRQQVLCGLLPECNIEEACNQDGICCGNVSVSENYCETSDIPLPGQEPYEGLIVGYRSYVNGICTINDYSPCDPQCVRVVDPCCRSECVEMGAKNCPDCVVTNGVQNISSVNIFYAKFTINNEDVCLPIACEDCSEYEPCES